MKKQDLSQTYIDNRLSAAVAPVYSGEKSPNPTQPDQSFTVTELLQGFLVGRTPPVMREVDYDLDPESVNGNQIGMLSLSEAEIYTQQVSERLSAAQERYKNLQDHVTKQKKAKKAEQEALQARIKALEEKGLA